MLVFFDYQAFEAQEVGGVSRSYSELISRLPKYNCKCEIGLKECNNAYINLPNIKPLHYTHDMFFGRKRFIGQRTISKWLLKILGHNNYALNINKEYCIKKIEQHRFNIFEPTFFDTYFLPYLKGKPFVMTVHDMIPELFPHFFSQDDIQIIGKKHLCPLASAIHVPSNKTKEDLVNILNIDPAKIYVIPHGYSTLPTTTNDQLPTLPYTYILYVGQRGGYKNFMPILDELKILREQEHDIHLVCTGSAFDNQERQHITELGLGEYVHQMHVDDIVLGILYRHAAVFVYPSAYEGFGLPILEAFQCGCPVMLNNASCFPEVASDAALYFDIKRRGDFADRFLSFYRSSQEDRQVIIKKGIERLGIYSWDKSSEKLSNLYKSLI